MKHKLLGVSNETLDNYGAVSANTAFEMCNGIRKYAKADLGLAVTGVAGPSCSENKPVGLVFIALCDKKHTWVERLMVINAENDREKVRNNTVTMALDLVRRYIEFLPDAMPGFSDKNDIKCINPEEFNVSMLNID